MKIEMKMNPRDQKLLVFLAVFVIVVGVGYWGVFPQIRTAVNLNNELSELKMQKQIDDDKIDSLPLVEATNEILEEKIAEAKSDFFPKMSSDEVDKYITGFALGYNLNAYELSIRMPDREAELSAYQFSEKYEQDLLRAHEESLEEDMSTIEMIENYANDNFYVDSEGASLTGVYEVGLSMNVGGTKKNLQNFLDDLFAIENKVLVRSYSWSTSKSLEFNKYTGEYEVNETPYLSIDMSLYMCQ